ncbi:hypothetical protein PIROE2DRAFT_63861 [Piromyces sp. E2]|nr:hypothetical protein PIROE2DRAFT_63861 [Piromyces sp. E2]|eukprot:OUM59307.1 hypothetical protein PIROE2DRAFT_63861 [Piromyces sp. E2]
MGFVVSIDDNPNKLGVFLFLFVVNDEVAEFDVVAGVVAEVVDDVVLVVVVDNETLLGFNNELSCAILSGLDIVEVLESGTLFNELAPAVNDPNNKGFWASAGKSNGFAARKGFKGRFGVGMGNGSFSFNFGFSNGNVAEVDGVLVVVVVVAFVLFEVLADVEVEAGLLPDDAVDIFNFGDNTLGVACVDDGFDETFVFFLSVKGVLEVGLVLVGGDLSCDEVAVLAFVFVADDEVEFGFIGAFFFILGTILGWAVVGVFKFLNGLESTSAGFMVAINACILASAAALGNILGCLFKFGKVPNGNNVDISNGFMFNNNCEMAGILLRFDNDAFNGKFAGNGKDVEGTVVFKFTAGFIGKGILLFKLDPNLLKLEAKVEFEVLFEVFNGKIGGTDEVNGTVEEVVAFFVEEFEEDEASLFELFFDLFELFIDGGMSVIGEVIIILNINTI